MTNFAKILAGAAAIGAFAAPAAAQYQNPYTPSYGYQQPYQQPYGANNGGVIGSIINQLLGNRYNVNDRTAITQCATAATAQVSAQYPPCALCNAYGYNNQGYKQGYKKVIPERRPNGYPER